MPPAIESDIPADLLPVTLPHLGNRGTALEGLTLLVVEDSRFACDALRLMCQRSGARMRRAESLRDARAHLRTYRPDAILVDLGLPDGRGEGLIRELALAGGPRRPVVLGMSGDPAGRGLALAAGAAGFLDKPISSLVAFQRKVQQHLPNPGADLAEDSVVTPDPLALHDDLAHAAALLANRPQGPAREYLTGFVTGLARATHDPALEAAAKGDAALRTALATRLSVGLGPLINPQRSL